jgi:non-specific protein-tyrosine kinase
MAEAIRQLRTSVGFLGVDSSIRSLVVTSSVADEGKTTVAANLALALAQTGEKVILVDAELREPGIGALLGIIPDCGLTSVLLGAVDLGKALHRWTDEVSLQILPSGLVPPNPSELLASQRMREVLEELYKRATVVIFDAPALLPVTDAAVLASLTDGAVLVTRVGTRREDLSVSAETLRHAGARVLGVVLNRVPGPRRRHTPTPRTFVGLPQPWVRDSSPRVPGVRVP